MARKLTPRIKALRLAIKDMERVCQENYTARKDASRYNLKFGLNALKNYNEHQQAIKILEDILNKETE